MKLAATFTLLGVFAASLATTVSYDTSYDVSSASLDNVACSDGANGLITRYGYKTQGQIPTFPNIGGSSDIAGYNSPACGTCYQVTYKGKSIYFLGIDHAAAGLNMAEAAMNNLTGGKAVQLGRIDATVTKVGAKKCGLPHK